MSALLNFGSQKNLQKLKKNLKLYRWIFHRSNKKSHAKFSLRFDHLFASRTNESFALVFRGVVSMWSVRCLCKITVSGDFLLLSFLRHHKHYLFRPENSSVLQNSVTYRYQIFGNIQNIQICYWKTKIYKISIHFL